MAMVERETVLRYLLEARLAVREVRSPTSRHHDERVLRYLLVRRPCAGP